LRCFTAVNPQPTPKPSLSSHLPPLRVYLRSVVACVSADVIYDVPEREMLLPGLLGQFSPGYVDAIVLSQGSSRAAEVTKVSRLCVCVRACVS
jgi:hypothetical protein